MKNHYTNNFHKNHYTNNSYKNHHTNITRINFVVINQINKHKVKYIITACIPIIIIKKFLLFAKNIYSYIKKNFFTTQLQNFSSFC